jgi:hypothetical protein
MRLAAEQDQPLHATSTLFYRWAFDAGDDVQNAFLRREAEHDRTAYIKGMLATSHHVALDTRSQARSRE